RTLQDGPANREKTAANVGKLEADLHAVGQQLGQKDLPEKDRKDLEKKLGTIERELEKQQAAVEQLDEELAKLPEVLRRCAAWLDQQRQETASAPQRRQQAAASLPRLIEQ